MSGAAHLSLGPGSPGSGLQALPDTTSFILHVSYVPDMPIAQNTSSNM
jgi:hypothetical protein